MRFLVYAVCLLSLVCVSTHAADEDDGPRTFTLINTDPGLSLHKEMYMLPATVSDEYDGSQTEAVFQISAKHRLFGSRFYFAYTQISFWQAYDHNNSAPFRETNYNPEVFYRFQRLPFHSGYFGADAGFEHESNGQIPPISRSWNLLYFSPYYFQKNLLLHLKLRYRIPEDAKETPDAMVGDDNPDITDYLGHSDLTVYWRFWKEDMLRVKLRGNLSTGNGGISINYSCPIPVSDDAYFCVRVSHGYGESLVDYKRSLTRFGLGFMFTR